MFYYTPPQIPNTNPDHKRREKRRLGRGSDQRLPTMVDGIRLSKTRRHGAATKKGIKKAKAHKIVVKKAKILLRKSKKHDIVQNLFFKAKPVG